MSPSSSVKKTSASTYDEERSVLPHLETTPIHFKAILAATDLSKEAAAPLKMAAGMAKQFHSRLQVVYAVMPDLYMADTTMLSSELQKIDVERAQHELHQYANRIPELRTTMHEEIARCGAPVDVITEMVSTSGIDLVVIGSHGRGTAGKIVMGSIAESVIRKIHCPVMVTGPHCEGHFKPPASIVLATDLPAASLRAAQYATSLARHFGSTLTVVHVVTEQSGSQAISERRARRDLRQLTPDDAELRKHVHFKVRPGDAANEIVTIARSSKADLIVMGAHEHGALADHAPWATLSHVIRESTCPVLAVQPHLA